MPIKMKELPLSERPYEKLEMYGEASLSNAELLAIIIKSGTKEESSIVLAQKILNYNCIKQDNQLQAIQDISVEELMKIKGIGKVKAIQVKAVCELSKRMARPIHSMQITISIPKDVSDLFMEELRYEKQERVKVLLLNTKNQLVKIMEVAIGGTNFANLEPKEALKEAVKMGVPKIVLVHNHPSGDPTPSTGDYQITEKIGQAAHIMGIHLLDHIIIGNGTFISLLAKRKE